MRRYRKRASHTTLSTSTATTVSRFAVRLNDRSSEPAALRRSDAERLTQREHLPRLRRFIALERGHLRAERR